MRDAELVEDIKVAHKANLGVYGARKIHAELNCEDVKVARCTIERLMRAEGLRGIPREKTRKTTLGDGGETERPEGLVAREFVAKAPNQLWVADLTYVRTHAGWTYVAFVLDVFSRMVVGWQVSTSLRTDLALDALDMGLWTRQRARQDVAGLIHHSDRGVQYRAIRYTERLAEAAAVASVGSRGDSYDNAMAEALKLAVQGRVHPQPGHAAQERLEIGHRHRDRRRRVRRLVQPPAPARRDRARPARRVRDQPLGRHQHPALPSNTRPDGGRVQVTEPPRNPGRFSTSGRRWRRRFTPFEPAVRQVLAGTPQMPATVIAERVGWTGSITWFRDNVRRLRPEHRPVDPADRLVWLAGDAAQCDLWFPPRRIPLEDGSTALLPRCW